MMALALLPSSRLCRACGTASAVPATICSQCGSDPVLSPDSLEQGRVAEGAEGDAIDDLIRAPEEDKALAVALLIVAGATAFLSTVTLGLFLLMLGASFVRIALQGLRVRSDWLVVGRDRLSVLHNLARTAAFRLGMPPVDVLLRQSRILNAQASGFGRQSWLLVESELVETMTPAELLFVLGHELGHIRRRHVFWMSLIGTPALPSVPFMGTFFGLAFSGWSQAAELSADRAGLLATRDPTVSCRALMKLALGGRLHSAVSEESFLASHEMQGDVANSVAGLGVTHPDLARRIRAIRAFWETVRPRSGRQ